jgi:hypothetical protein
MTVLACDLIELPLVKARRMLSSLNLNLNLNLNCNLPLRFALLESPVL